MARAEQSANNEASADLVDWAHCLLNEAKGVSALMLNMFRLRVHLSFAGTACNLLGSKRYLCIAVACTCDAINRKTHTVNKHALKRFKKFLGKDIKGKIVCFYFPNLYFNFYLN